MHTRTTRVKRRRWSSSSVNPSKAETQLRVTESGFDRLPPEGREVAYRGNADGWTAQLRAIQAYVG